MTMIAGERAGRGTRAPMLPTPTLPSYRDAACADRSARKDWRDAENADPLHQRFLANTYCAHCPITDFCLTQALERRELAGVRGGLVAEELERAYELAHPRKTKDSKKKPTPAPTPAAAESAPELLGVAA